jgi:hypothetical protein
MPEEFHDSMRQKIWVYSPPKPKVPDAVKVEVETKAMALVNDILKPEHVKPPPKNAKWNYIVDIYTKWHRNYFYFCTKYACPGPNALSPFLGRNVPRKPRLVGGVKGHNIINDIPCREAPPRGRGASHRVCSFRICGWCRAAEPVQRILHAPYRQMV